MDTEKAHYILDLDSAASLEEMESAYREKLTDIMLRLQHAPTAHLKKLFSRKLEELNTAKEHLLMLHESDHDTLPLTEKSAKPVSIDKEDGLEGYGSLKLPSSKFPLYDFSLEMRIPAAYREFESVFIDFSEDELVIAGWKDEHIIIIHRHNLNKDPKLKSLESIMEKKRLKVRSLSGSYYEKNILLSLPQFTEKYHKLSLILLQEMTGLDYFRHRSHLAVMEFFSNQSQDARAVFYEEDEERHYFSFYEVGEGVFEEITNSNYPKNEYPDPKNALDQFLKDKPWITCNYLLVQGKTNFQKEGVFSIRLDRWATLQGMGHLSRIWAGKVKDHLLLGTLGFNLYYKVDDHEEQLIMHKEYTIPTKKTEEFTNDIDFPESMTVQLLLEYVNPLEKKKLLWEKRVEQLPRVLKAAFKWELTMDSDSKKNPIQVELKGYIQKDKPFFEEIYQIDLLNDFLS